LILIHVHALPHPRQVVSFLPQKFSGQQQQQQQQGQSQQKVTSGVVSQIKDIDTITNIQYQYKNQNHPCNNLNQQGSKMNSLSACASFDGNVPNLSSFAFHLFSQLVSSKSSTENDNNNVLISPLSIASALGLVLAGATADSTCQTQIQSVLDIQSHSDIPLLSNILLPPMSSSPSSSGVDLTIANGIWTTKEIKEEYIQNVQNVHNGIAETLGGSGDAQLPLSYDPINEFVSQKTNGMIDKLLEGEVDPLTVAILVNAVYFKGSWKEQFKKSNTKEGKFNTINNDGKIEQHDAMLMQTIRKIDVGTNMKSLGGAHAVLLEYGQEEEENKEEKEGNGVEFGAMFLLPKENTKKSMQVMISNLTSLMTKKEEKQKGSTTATSSSSSAPIHKILDSLYSQKVNLKIPRFKISYGVKSLKEDLKHLGIKSAFNDDNMFHQMSDDPLVHLDDVYHKTAMEVTEEGTVAVAATAGVMMTRSLPAPPIDIEFDRPFVMIVFHLSTGVPLFIGKIDDPELLV